jgi:NAD(P)-dependent dehydrogenase (short-subunit alcohol dehydrogenase family)
MEALVDTSLLGMEGKAALVVGGGQGMGESSATFLARAGCDVAVLDVEAARAERVAGAVRDLGRKGVAVVADVLDDAQVAGAVATAERELGGLDALVSIVGQAAWNPILEMTPEQWDLDHRRNLRYFFFLARAVAQSLVRRGRPGAMVCIASVDGLQSAAHHASYGAAKAGLVNLVRTMAVEWAPHNIRVNAIAPGSIATPRFPETPEFRERTRQGLIPMKRRGSTDEIGKAALFLLSDLASYVTGHTLPVDGGWMAASISPPADMARFRS